MGILISKIVLEIFDFGTGRYGRNLLPQTCSTGSALLGTATGELTMQTSSLLNMAAHHSIAFHMSLSSITQVQAVLST
jgi:hypothetical protein